MHRFSTSRPGVAEHALSSDYIYSAFRRVGLILVCALLLSTFISAAFASAALAQEPYPAPAVDTAPAAPTAISEEYPAPNVAAPAPILDPTSYPDPGQPTTGPAAPSADQVNAAAVATPVPMPSVPVDGGSQVSLLLVGLVLLGLVVVVGLILARRRK